jgi:hypothetical protein
METETRRALELESAVRQGAGFNPRCCADQKEGKGTEADANTANREFGKTAGQLDGHQDDSQQVPKIGGAQTSTEKQHTVRWFQV